MSTEFHTMESTSKRIDVSEIDDSLLVELLDESSYLEEDDDDEDTDRLLRVIQSLEAEIGVEFGAMDVDLLDDLSDLDSVIGSGSIECRTGQDDYMFEWMEVESEARESDIASWYLESDLVEYGEMREYPYFCYNDGEEFTEQEEYCYLWE